MAEVLIMKAASFVMTHYQKPMTLFGFPLMIFMVAAMSIVFTMMIAFKVFGGLIAFGLVFAVGTLWVYLNRKLFRHDHHADLVLQKGFNRWGFTQKHINITAGRS